ncbi:hypothetical protein B0O80DRAFT_443899 [Mortierella sp. GBAus27b]|nr:hypothetical protein B0O80DRAFT_443899 [Mortierella sp. GBAus27b]
MATQFVSVASLVPDQHHCNLRVRVLSVETIAESIHPETGDLVQSAEAIVGDDTAFILLNLKNDQVNLLANNARLRVLNGHVNMYRGFMRLEVNEEEDDDSEGREKPSITAILDEDEDGNKGTVTQPPGEPSLSPSSSPFGITTEGSQVVSGSDTTSSVETASSNVSTTAIVTESSNSTPPAASVSLSSSLPLNREPLEVEMKLGTGGSVPLMEYYRTIEFTYFSTVEPVGR